MYIDNSRDYVRRDKNEEKENDLSYSEVFNNSEYRNYILSKVDKDEENEEDEFSSKEPDEVTEINRFGDEFWEVDGEGNKKKFLFKAREIKLNESIDDKLFNQAKKRFEDLCNTTGREYLLYEEGGIEGWTLRDFVSEAYYQYDMRKDEDAELRAEGRRWLNFVKKYEQYLTDDIKCKINHVSKYDLK